jgi:hypothetical protein
LVRRSASTRPASARSWNTASSMCIWHLTAYTSPRRYRRAAAVIADPATGLVFPLPDPQNAVVPTGHR